MPKEYQSEKSPIFDSQKSPITQRKLHIMSQFTICFTICFQSLPDVLQHPVFMKLKRKTSCRILNLSHLFWMSVPNKNNNIKTYSPAYKYLRNYQWRHASESRATDTTDNSGGHISQSKCNLQFGRESRVFTIFIAVSRPRDGWYIDTWTLSALTYYWYTHAIQ